MSWFLLQKLDHYLKAVVFCRAAALFCVFVLLLAGLAPAASAAGTPDNPRLSDTEAWVLKQIKEGKAADLEAKFGQEDHRRQLTAGFVKKLLAGGFKNVQISYLGVNLAHAVIAGGPLDLSSLALEYPLALSQCLFTVDLTLAKSHLKKGLSLTGSIFQKDADFRGIKVDGRVNIEQAVFEGGCSWVDAEVSEKFLANGAAFKSASQKADFRTMHVATEAYFVGARFYGPVDFEMAHIGVRLNMNQAEFFDKDHTASFLAMMVDKYALFNGARFHGPVSFVIAQIGIQFWADGAEFLYPEGSTRTEFLDPEEPGADFRSIKTGNSIFFRKAVFQGPVRFEFAEIGLNFRATGARFACNPKSFSQMKVGQEVFLDNVTINCDIDLSYGEFHDVVISGTIPEGGTVQQSSMNIPKLTLNGVQVQRDLTIANAKIGELLASNVHVKGPARFNNIAIRTLADFRHSVFEAMNFTNVAWPQPTTAGGKIQRKICLNGLTYSSLNIDRQEDQDHSGDYQESDFKAINRFVENSPFNTQTYVQLETFFRRIGKEDWANREFILMKDRDLEENLSWYDPVRWLEWLFWGRLAGYGKKPIRVFFISMTLIILGAYLFDPEYLTDNKKSTDGKVYRSVLLRVFLSVDRFLPIELGLAKHWDAKANHFFIWFYFHLQQILGWILIPIALASIYTQIK